MFAYANLKTIYKSWDFESFIPIFFSQLPFWVLISYFLFSFVFSENPKRKYQYISQTKRQHDIKIYALAAYKNKPHSWVIKM